MDKPIYYAATETGEKVFQVAAPGLKFGPGALAEVGGDARDMGMKRVALITDANVGATESAAAVMESLNKAGLDVAVYDQTRVEPTDTSFLQAARFAGEGNFDGYVSLGGGSAIDTAKVANLLACYPGDLMAYVNAPIGAAKPVPGPVKPHIACPTTCGTGSETTQVAVFDLVAQQVKTGISSKFLRPVLAVVDATTIDSLPPGIVAATGFDVLTHAIESYTAKPYTARPRPGSPEAPGPRPPYQGANPFSDMGSLKAINLGGRYLVRAVRDRTDTEARDGLMLAATLAGMSFGNAGVHIPHAMSYSVAGLNHTYRAPGYEKVDPMVPHGISVVLNAPAAFRFTGPVAPERHLEAALALGAEADAREVNGRKMDGGEAGGAGEVLAARLIAMMKETGLAPGLAEIGYGEADIPALVKGAYAQQRLLAQAPCPVSEDNLASLYRAAMKYW